jgi:RNA polymerase sigma-70 factor (ECF subfamily)
LRRRDRLNWLSLDAIRGKGSGDPAGDMAEAEPIRLALEALNEGQREVLLLFSYSGLGAEEVARVLGVTAAAARKRRQRARQAFAAAYRAISGETDDVERDDK